MPDNLVYDNASSSKAANTNSLAWAHTTGTDYERLLVVCTGAGDAVAADRLVTGITYNGQSLTKIREDSSGAGAAGIWYLINPDSGSNTVTISFTGTCTGVTGGAITLSRAKQSGQPDANNGANGTSTTPTVDVTTSADNCWVIDSVSCQAQTPSVGSGQTSRWNEEEGGLRSAGSTEGPKTPAGAVTMSWTITSAPWWISAASFAPSGTIFVQPTTGAALGAAGTPVTKHMALPTTGAATASAGTPTVVHRALATAGAALAGAGTPITRAVQLLVTFVRNTFLRTEEQRDTELQTEKRTTTFITGRRP